MDRFSSDRYCIVQSSSFVIELMWRNDLTYYGWASCLSKPNHSELSTKLPLQPAEHGIGNEFSSASIRGFHADYEYVGFVFSHQFEIISRSSLSLG
jgi:hypothetical protein